MAFRHLFTIYDLRFREIRALSRGVGATAERLAALIYELRITNYELRITNWKLARFARDMQSESGGAGC